MCMCVKGKGLLYDELKSIKLSRVDCFDDRKIIVNHISHLLFLAYEKSREDEKSWQLKEKKCVECIPLGAFAITGVSSPPHVFEADFFGKV